MVYTFDWVCISFLKVCLLTVESTWCCSWRLHVTVLLSDCHISTYINDILRIYGCTWLYKPVRVNLYWHQKMLWVRHRAETIPFVYRWIMITNAIVLFNIIFFFLKVKKKNYECATYSSVNSELLLKIPGGSCLIWFPFKYLRNGHITEYLISPLWVIIIPRWVCVIVSF